MELKKVKLTPWPVALNTYDDERVLRDNECVANRNLILLPNGDVGVRKPFVPFDLDDTTRIINGVFFEAKGHPNKMFVFGHNSTGGFIGYIEQGKSDLVIVLDNLAKYRVPRFVKFREALYLFNVYKPGYDCTIKWVPDYITGTYLPQCGVGCLFRGSLFISNFDEFDTAQRIGPGYVQYTNVGEEVIEPENWFPVGATDESVVDMIPFQDRIAIQKEHESWEIYFPSSDMDTAQVRCISPQIGELHHTCSQRHFDSLFYFGDRGAHIQNPRVINVNPEQLLEVAPNVVDITRPIKDRFTDLFARDLVEQEVWERGVETPWTILLPEFQDKFGLSRLPSGWLIYPTQSDVTGWGISVPINLPTGNFRFSRLTAMGKVAIGRIPNDCIKIYVSSNCVDWDKLDIKEIVEWSNYREVKWDCNIYNYVKDTGAMYFKIWLRDDGLGSIVTEFDDIIIYCMPVGKELFGSGLYRENYMVLGQDKDYLPVALAFKDGWLDIDNNSVQIFNLTAPILWSTDYDIVGFGTNAVTGKGCLLKLPIPEETSGTLVYEGRTKKQDFLAPEVPKKLRKILLTYKTVEGFTLYIYGESGLIRTYDLPAKSEFGIEEINLRTDRSKWFQFEIKGENFDFILRDFEVHVKTFAPDEV